VTATISQIKSGLATRLATISGLRTFAYQPDQLNAPLAYPMVEQVLYHRTMFNGLNEIVFTVTVIVARPTERPAEASLDAYVSPTGASSIRAAIEGDRTLGGIVDDCQVEQASGISSLSANDADYLSVDFTVRVYAS
jgi:hypothetical protein